MTYNTNFSLSKKEKLLSYPSFLPLRTPHKAVIKFSHLKNSLAKSSRLSLINLLTCQIARYRRLAIPPVRIHLRVISRTGNVPVKLRLGATNS
ncbi:hypothetical protein [Bartonella ancashensis]|uniref:hypothetical protein n=1 Tax=Bartonella ancashensis TaxID=1318743 RepID=UPI0008FC985F|nr:hypothetical protein [Bartonella ancashensis]